MVVVLSGHHLHDLMGLQQGVSDNVLVGDHTVCQAENGHLALGLATPDLHLVVTQLQAGHTVYTVQSCPQFCNNKGFVFVYLSSV